MSQVEQSIVTALVDNLAERRRWDEPAELYWLNQVKGRVRLVRIPAMRTMFQLGRPPVVLATLAHAATDRRHEIRRSVPAGLCGVAFFAEAWTVQYDTDEEVREAVRRRDTEPLSAHSRRVEQRALIAVERTGCHFYVTQPRGGAIRTEVEQRGTPDSLHSGAIPAALDALLAAVLGVDLIE
ncbi:hypothetical protein [Mycolicibacterium cosmeticum]|uniref:hypothetical protein n=1 Tax=Mycolicibacterium cosmeticum TaxID=258533 RepID=UPI00320498BD